MGITGNNCKAETAEDLNEYFCRRIIPNLRSSTDAQRCILKNKPMGKDSWTHDPVGDVSCSFTNEQEMFGRLEALNMKKRKEGEKRYNKNMGGNKKLKP